MTGQDFIGSMLALRAWEDGREDGLSAMLAIAFVFRNRVRAGWETGDWIKVLQNYKNSAATERPPSDEIPDPRALVFQQLLQQMSGIISGSIKDEITVTQPLAYGGGSILSIAPPPALYYGRLNEINREWFLENISRNPAHQRTANVGTLFFWT
jgi:hypothetical protein